MFCIVSSFKRLARAAFFAVIFAFSQTVQASPAVYPTTGPTSYGSAACNNPIIRTVNVPDSFAITDLNVLFRASHVWRTDTNLSVTSPNGTVVDLLTGPYGSSWDNYNVIFDDEASVTVDTGAHATHQSTTGAPMNVNSEGDPLSEFDGENATGVWSFSICDVYTIADPGNVIELSLVFEVGPELNIAKSVNVYTPGSYALPGNDVIYTFDLDNSGAGAADADTILLIDTLPPEVEFYNGDMDDTGTLTTDPVAFSQSGAGLSFNYATDVRFSDSATRPTNFSSCSYTPIAGYDPNVKHICINPKGAFAAGTPDPSAAISFRVRIK